ncbi:hypothetical protein BKA62DRAFT_708139 [Auriculariales sp. MPI-PUGE-AT-0066]|nr:hypothetical protein BKA62DRAFT_708139 [Auriculariales sp. MPI-PUGE-AT-0066]
MEKLPIELVTHIFQVAAYLFRSTDRGAVVRLTLTSSFVYNAVAPILYERLIIASKSEIDGFLKLMMEGQATVGNVLKHARFMCTGPRCFDIPSWAAALLVKVDTVHCPTEVWYRISRAQVERRLPVVRTIHIWQLGLTMTSHAHLPNLRMLTRIHCFLPYRSVYLMPDENGPGSAWLGRMLQLLPSLTHLASATSVPVRIEEFERMVRTLVACQQPCIQVFALRFVGLTAACLRAHIHAAREVDNDWVTQKMRVWVDMRGDGTYCAEEESLFDDARNERSIWTEAKPLSAYVFAPQALPLLAIEWY